MDFHVLYHLNFPYLQSGITGANIRIDNNGDSEGNFSVLAFKESHFVAKDLNFTCQDHMIQVATFHSNGQNSLYVR